MNLYPHLETSVKKGLINPIAFIYVVFLCVLVFAAHNYFSWRVSRQDSTVREDTSLFSASSVFDEFSAAGLDVEPDPAPNLEPEAVYTSLQEALLFRASIASSAEVVVADVRLPPYPQPDPTESSIVDVSTLPSHRLAASRVVVLPNVDLFGFDPAQSPDFCLDWDYGRSECLSMMNSGLDWRDYYEKAIACPIEFPLGAVVEVGLGDNHLYYTCLDRGSSVVCDGGQCRFGILTHDLVSLPDFREVSIWIP